MTNTEIKEIVYRNSTDPRRIEERQYLYYKGFLETAGENIHNLRRARMDAYMLDHYTIEVNAFDLLVGRFSLTFTMTEEQRREAEEARRIIAITGEYQCGAKQANTAHRVPDYELLLREGAEGVLSRVRKQREALDPGTEDFYEKDLTYQSMEISLSALIRFGYRTSESLEQYAQCQLDINRKNELHRLAKIFRQIPAKPATTFYEAIQSMWFLQFVFTLLDDVALSGRMDRYLYPYYKKDIDEGRITRAFAMQLIEQLYFKHNEIYMSWPASVMIGGVDRFGQPVWNELTYMCIEAIRTTGLINPSVSVCYTEDMPDDLLRLCTEIIAEGYTRPAFFNDAVIQKGLRNAGVSVADARDYVHSTCVEITPNAASNILVATPYVNLCKAFEYVLYEKKNSYTVGPLMNVGPGWGGVEHCTYLAHDVSFSLDALDTFEKFFDLMKTVISEIIASHIAGVFRITEMRRRYTSSPLASAFLNDCITLGKDAGAGGARYNFCYPNFPGIINVIDSLAAIRQIVYEEKRLTLQELASICKSNYAGQEPLRQYIRNHCPKFGNDDDRADALAIELYDFIDKEVSGHISPLGASAHPSYFAYVVHGEMGMITDATPDGRLAGEALSEHLGAVVGMDRSGPTAVMHSIAKLDQSKGIGGIATNYRFAKNFIQTKAGNTAVCNFIRSFMKKGCFEIQFNVVDKQTLLDARENPDAYRTLLVRVAGYSDYFVNLAENVKDEVIARTENGGC
ncbi:MAG: hypothetical protein IJW77_16630 [Clostridia bacterium]|nr:hypothetical protein [Clostridia bacterium]